MITSALKTLLVLALALPLAIYLGSEIGSEEYVLPAIIGALALFMLLKTLFLRDQPLDCLVLTFLLSGYIVGNRGFAQLSITPPLYVGEVGLAIIIAATAFRFVLTRTFPVSNQPLTWCITAYLLVAFARLLADVRDYGFEAARDSAIVYYAIFFFVGYQFGQHKNATGFLNRKLGWAFTLLGIVATIKVFQPDWLEIIKIRGDPLLAQKGDLTATFAVVGIFFLALRPEVIRLKWLRYPLIPVLLVAMILIFSRAALVALLITLALPWLAALPRFRVYTTLLFCAGIIGLLVVGSLSNSTALSSYQEQLTSVVDVSGNHLYETDFGDIKSADNAFRRNLWQSFYDQTVQDNHWFLGRGFGYNFIPQSEEELATPQGALRSAHNYYVTVFGRLGVVGFSLLLVITVLVALGSLRTALSLRRGEAQDSLSLVYWCAACVILISGTFGVVMEGPMGAIPFWSFLGLAVAHDEKIIPRVGRVTYVPEEMPLRLPRERARRVSTVS